MATLRGGEQIMNDVVLKGILRGIEPSHEIGGIQFSKASLIVPRSTGKEDIINLRFKTFSNKHKESEEVTVKGNVRSYSYKIDGNKNKVVIYVFTYFDDSEASDVNKVTLDGRICKLNTLRRTASGKDNIHFIVANNVYTNDGGKRLNSYIPCIAWGKIAKSIAELHVNSKIEVLGELHSREHKKIHEDGEVEFRVAHELLVTGYKVIE